MQFCVRCGRRDRTLAAKVRRSGSSCGLGEGADIMAGSQVRNLLRLCRLYFGLIVYPLGYSSGPAGLHACIVTDSTSGVAFPSLSRRVWQTGRKDAAAAAHTVH